MKLHDRVLIPRLYSYLLSTFKQQIRQFFYAALLQTMRKMQQSWKTELLIFFYQNFSVNGVKTLTWKERCYKITQPVKLNLEKASKASTLTVQWSKSNNISFLPCLCQNQFLWTQTSASPFYLKNFHHLLNFDAFLSKTDRARSS